MEFLRNVGKAVSQNVLGKGLEKPAYEKVETEHSDYEVRHYPATKWVSTDVVSMEYRDAGRQGFWKLFKYIQGNNASESKVEMTAPVTVKVLPGEGPNCENTFKVSFYVPSMHQEKPPSPSDSSVHITEEPAKKVFVSSFGGFANDEQWTQEAQKLAQKLDGKEKVNTAYFYTAGYDSPFKMFNRLNEVWFEELPSSESD